METGKYALPASRSPCELKERGRQDRCLYRGLGRDGLHESADDRHFPETLQADLCVHLGDRRVRRKCDDGGDDARGGLLRREKREK